MGEYSFMFEKPIFLVAFLLLPILIGMVLYLRNRQYIKSFVPFSSLVLVKSFTKKENPLPLIIVISLLIFTFIVQTLAVAQIKLEQRLTGDGENIAIAMDISNSMIAQDMNPNRFEVQKGFVKDLVNSLSEDSKISLVLFSGTVEVVSRGENKEQVLEKVNSLDLSDLSPQTAIGSALVNSYRLISEISDENIGDIFIITDGESNSGPDPLTIVENLGNENIRIFSIGIGSPDEVSIKIRFDDETETETTIPPLETEVLQDIANKSGGQFFRAENTEGLTDIIQMLQDNSILSTSTKIINIDEVFQVLSFIGVILFGSYAISRFR